MSQASRRRRRRVLLAVAVAVAVLTIGNGLQAQAQDLSTGGGSYVAAVAFGTPATLLFDAHSRPLDYRRLVLKTHATEAVEVVWKGTHTLYQLTSKENFDNCDFTGATAVVADAQIKGYRHTLLAPPNVNESHYYASNVGAEQRYCKLGARFELHANRLGEARNPKDNAQCHNFCADSFVFTEEDRNTGNNFYGYGYGGSAYEVVGEVGSEYCRRTFDAPLTKSLFLDGAYWMRKPGCYWTECSYATCPDGTSILAYKHWEAAACKCAAISNVPQPLLCNYTMFCGPYKNTEPTQDYSVCDDTDTSSFYGLLSPEQAAARARTDYICDIPAVDMTSGQMRRLCCMPGGLTAGPDETTTGVLPSSKVVELGPLWPMQFRPMLSHRTVPSRVDTGQSFTVAGGMLNADGSDPQRVALNETLSSTQMHGGGQYGRTTNDGSRKLGAPQWRRSLGYTPDGMSLEAFPNGRLFTKAPMATSHDEKFGYYKSRPEKVIDLSPWGTFSNSYYRESGEDTAVYRWGGKTTTQYRHFTGEAFMRQGYLLAPEEYFDTYTAFRTSTARPILKSDTRFAREPLTFPWRCAKGYYGTKACIQCHDRCSECTQEGYEGNCISCNPGFALVGNIEYGASCMKCGACPVGQHLAKSCTVGNDRQCYARPMKRNFRASPAIPGRRAENLPEDPRSTAKDRLLNEVYVTGARSFTPNGVYQPGDIIFISLAFSRPIYVDTTYGSPTLLMNTGWHYEEEDAPEGVAEFVGGGHGETKGLWLNNAPGPIKSGFPQPCRAAHGYKTGANEALGRAEPGSSATAGPKLCLNGPKSVYGDRTHNQDDLKRRASDFTQVQSVLMRKPPPSIDEARLPVLPSGEHAPPTTKSALDDPPVARYDQDEKREEQATDQLLVFAYRVGPADRTPHLDYVPPGTFYGIHRESALELNGARIGVVRGTNTWEPGRSNKPMDIRGNYVRTGYDAWQHEGVLDFTESRQYAATVDHHSGHPTEKSAITDAVADFYGATVSLKLPHPGDPLNPDPSMRNGMPGSLSATSKLVVGHAFVTRAGARIADGTYGRQRGTASNTKSASYDVMRLYVQWSEPIKVACPRWTTRGDEFRPHKPGIEATCLSMHLLLPTGDITIDTSHGFFGDGEVEPTSFLITAGTGHFEWEGKGHKKKLYYYPDPANELTFEYAIRRYDNVDRLAYCDDNDECLHLSDGAAILRVSDSTPAGTVLPPEDSPYSLRSMHEIAVVTETADFPFEHPEEAVTFRATFRYLSLAGLGNGVHDFIEEYRRLVAHAADVDNDMVHVRLVSGSVVALTTVTFHAYVARLTFKETKVERFVAKIRHDSSAGRNLVSSHFDRKYGTPAVSTVRASFVPHIISLSFRDVNVTESFGSWEGAQLDAPSFETDDVSCCVTTIIARVVVPAQIAGGLTASIGDQRIGLNYDSELTLPHCSYSDDFDAKLVVHPWGDTFTHGDFEKVEWTRSLTVSRRGGYDSGCFYGLNVADELIDGLGDADDLSHDHDYSTPYVCKNVVPQVLSVSLYDVNATMTLGTFDGSALNDPRLAISCSISTVMFRVVVPANIVGCLTAFLGDQRIGLNFNNLVTLPACSDDDVAGGALQIVVRPWAGDPSTAPAWIRTLRVRAMPPPKETEEPPSFYGMYGFYGMGMN